jgi:hypothetical protein
VSKTSGISRIRGRFVPVDEPQADTGSIRNTVHTVTCTLWENVGSMGKVQDTIKRIARRHRHNATQPIALVIPNQKPPTGKSFPTSFNEVAGWLASHTSETYEDQLIGLSRALRHTNRLTNTATERLKINALFKTQIDAVLPSLKQQFVDVELPYDRESAEAFENAATLLQELAYGYKIALVDTLKRRSGLHRLDRIQSMYSAMRYLGELGLRYSQSHQPWPAKCWRDINTLYWLAEKDNAIDEIVRGNSNDPNPFPLSIGGLYCTIATFYLSDHQQLNATDFEQLLGILSEVLHKASLQQSVENSADSMSHSVALNSAGSPMPHRFCNYNSEDQIRYLDLATVAKTLIENTTHSKTALSRLQIQKITHLWGGQRARRVARTIGEQKAYIQTGLNNCHAFLQQAGPHHAPANSSWQLINRSAHGLSLCCKKTNISNLRVGTLITCRLHDTNNSCFYTGITRWIKIGNNRETRIGIEMIGGNMNPVICQKRAVSETAWEPRLEALMSETDIADAEHTLIIPANRYRLGETVNICQPSAAAVALPYRLAEHLDYDASFDCFRATAVKADQ